MATPFLDSLAKSSLKLENYYVQPICTPSRSQLMSGRYQIHTGLQHSIISPPQPNALPIDNILLPEQLQSCGYDTHMVGKWHLGFYKKDFLPWNRGFNTFFGYLTGSEDYYTHKNCFNITGKRFCGYDMRSEKEPTNSSFGFYSADVFAQKSIDVIYNTDREKPMFLYLALQSVHGPLQVPESYIKPFSFVKDIKRRKYLGMVRAMDAVLENITMHLKFTGRWENTIFIFSTDNGGQVKYGGNNWPLRGSKNTYFEGGIRGVGFLHSKLLDSEVNGFPNRDLIHISDWYPTLLSAAKCPLMKGTQPLDGFNQWPTLTKQMPSQRDEILINIDDYKVTKPVYRMGFDITSYSAIRTAEWKLITGLQHMCGHYKPPEWFSFEMTEALDTNECDDQVLHLYNIALDPEELTDLSKSFPDVVDRLLVKLANYNATAVPARYPPYDPKSDPSLHGGFWGPWQ
uniref:Arylsulfatase B-like n=1 Tax=Phallusia mammillata TaxID=59560 RepID=A0A6F9D7H5_9ASCI|nr:arylsulfatase B-like [Phallusia mammillata]